MPASDAARSVAHISGIVVHAPLERALEAAERIDALPGAEVRAREGGKMVVVLEAADEHALNQLFNDIALMEDVYSCALVSHFRDDPDANGDEPCS